MTNIGYHSSCYKNFIAIPNPAEKIAETSTSSSEQLSEKVLRSQVQQQESTSSGVFQKLCIFCNHQHKTINNKIALIGSSEIKEAEQAVHNTAILLQDAYLPAKIGHLDFVAKEVKYHHYCHKAYLNRGPKGISSQDTFT